MQKIFPLQGIRRIVASIYFILIGFAFVDFSATFSSAFLNGLLFVQFTPSVLKFIRLGGILASGFILVIILTLLAGRVYCSALCPLGIFQDIAARFRPKKSRYKYMKPWNFIRYTTLALVVVSAALGFLFVLNFLEPYSFAGRIFSDLIRPAYYSLNNLLVKVLGLLNSYALHHVDFKGFPWQGIAITGSLTAVLVFVSWRWGRIFCNSFCPVGAFLSILSRFSAFKLVIDEASCTSCNRCLRSCKAGCIDIKNKSIDFSRCVACFNCIDSCKEGGIGYKPSFGSKTKGSSVKESDNSRRSFLVAISGVAVGLSAIGSSFNAFAQNRKKGQAGSDANAEKKSFAGTKPNSRNAPITPPGSVTQKDFLNACTACHLCVSVCPTLVIQPSINEFGLFGLLQPHMDFHSGFCNFECTKCGEVCPTGAIRPLQLETKKRTQLGKAKFHMGNCIVRVDRTECGACSEHCPTKAVYMIDWQGLHLPEVNEDICIGCGACEYACPTQPYKAIFVNGNIEHQVAQLPLNTDEGPRKTDVEDFPF